MGRDQRRPRLLLGANPLNLHDASLHEHRWGRDRCWYAPTRIATRLFSEDPRRRSIGSEPHRNDHRSADVRDGASKRGRRQLITGLSPRRDAGQGISLGVRNARSIPGARRTVNDQQQGFRRITNNGVMNMKTLIADIF